MPLSGLRMINVDWSESHKRKYVNPNEVQKGLDLLIALSLDYEIHSTLVITPVSTSACKRDSLSLNDFFLTLCTV